MKKKNSKPLPRIPKPYSQLADVLYRLIIKRRKGLSERDTSYNGFRARISELKNEYNLNLQFYLVPFDNRFGKKSVFHLHYLRDQDQLKARKIYLKINPKRKK